MRTKLFLTFSSEIFPKQFCITSTNYTGLFIHFLQNKSDLPCHKSQKLEQHPPPSEKKLLTIQCLTLSRNSKTIAALTFCFVTAASHRFDRLMWKNEVRAMLVTGDRTLNGFFNIYIFFFFFFWGGGALKLIITHQSEKEIQNFHVFCCYILQPNQPFIP